jgi:hypothetical protein
MLISQERLPTCYVDAVFQQMRCRECLPSRDVESFGRHNLQALRSHHPGKPSGFNIKRILGKGDLWITEYTISYQAGAPQSAPDDAFEYFSVQKF